MKTRSSLLALVVLSTFAAMVAAAQDEGAPSAMRPGTRPFAEVPLVVMPPVDAEAALAEDKALEGEDVPFRFAIPIPVSMSPVDQGLWEKLDGDTWMWRVRLASRGALTLNLGFTRFHMPPGGRLLVYSADMKDVIRPFTAEDNASHGELWTPVVRGDELVVEATVPTAARGELDLVLGFVNHDYRGFGTPEFEKSASCNVDILCPQGNSWQSQSRSVARITISGAGLCSGAMLNNTALDRKPYFLTANHCTITPANAASVVTYWNYQNSTCRTPGSAASGNPGNGSLSQFETGTFFRAANAASDFTLIELDAPPNPAYNIYWSGWDRAGTPSLPCNGAAVCASIHHPSGDEKRISLSDLNSATTSYGGTAAPGDGTHYWVKWSRDGAGVPINGITEPGSSGSAFFDSQKRVVGQLHGGPSSCAARFDSASDYYGKLSHSWTGAGTSSTRLADWLDPIGSGVTNLDGRDAACTTRPTFAGLQSAVASGCGVTLTWNAGTPACGNAVTYNVYRSTSPGQAPSLTNRIARCVTGTTYTNTSVQSGVRYYYVVRAEDNSGEGEGPCGGNEDLNTTERNDVPSGTTNRFSDNLESGAGNWLTAGSPGWTYLTGTSASPTHSLFASDPAIVADQILYKATTLVLGAGAQLVFNLRYLTEGGFDGIVLEYTTNGTTWQDILAGNGAGVPANASRFLQNGYTGTISLNDGSPIAGRLAWSGTSGGVFRLVTVNLGDMAGQTVGFRWRMVTDAGVSVAGGAWIDDVSITEPAACGGTGAQLFYPVAPCRVADTRTTTPLSYRGERNFTVGGQCGVPSTARSVSLNVTGTEATAPGNARVYPAGTTIPGASNLNYATGQTRANNVVVGLGDAGAVTVFCSQASGRSHMIIDVNGYFQ